MAQFFAPVLQLDGEEIWTPTTFLGKPYNQLLVCSPAVNMVYRFLSVQPAVVAWMSELSNSQNVREKYKDIDPELYDAFFDAVHDAKHMPQNPFLQTLDQRKSDEIMTKRNQEYLINLDTKEYIDLKQHTKDVRLLDVLPYMTVVTTYNVLSLDGIQPFSGKWAFQRLQLVTKVPRGFKKLSLDF